MKDLKLSSMGIWISVGDDYAIKLASSGAAPSSEFCGQNPRMELAKRIVACVNACEGFDTEGLVRSVEIGETLPVMRDRMIKRELELQMQRDELLAALVELRDQVCNATSRRPVNEAREAADIVIARVKGGAA